MELERNALGWSVLAVAGALVLATFGFLAWWAATGVDRPPEVEVTLGAPQQLGGRHLVAVTVHNGGTRTAEELLVEVTAGSGPGAERAQISFDYLPGGSTRHARASFRADPAKSGGLAARVVGYREP